jgi:biotin operon repressor
MANKQIGKRAKDTEKFENGAANKPAHRSARQTRRPSAAQSVAMPSDPVAAAAPALSEKTADKDAAPTIRDKAVEQAAAPSASQSGGADAVTPSTSGTERPPASTKRAKLIELLERGEGASVAEIGERLGWLPHTVRAAITGLRHAGRQVTRSKGENGRSIYRLVPVDSRER